jgi:flagellar basal body P-ring formation protein FlgA
LLLLTVALLAVLVLGPMALSQPMGAVLTVCMRNEVSVQHTALILGDIADLSGLDEDRVELLSRTPLGSVTDVRLLSRPEVEFLIRSAFPEPNEVKVTGSEFTRVAVVMRRPETGELAAILKAHLASVSPWRMEEIEIRSIDNLAAIELPPGDVQLRVSSRGLPSSFRSALLSMEAVLDGRPLRTFWIKADVQVRARVVKLVNAVPYGTTLRAEDLQEIECEIVDPRPDYVRAAAEAVGMTARRILMPGDLLQRSWLNESRMVSSGETVRLWQQFGGVSVAALARALQNGKLGDRIKVRNIDSDRAITAVVTGRGEVRVVR